LASAPFKHTVQKSEGEESKNMFSMVLQKEITVQGHGLLKPSWAVLAAENVTE